MAETPVPITTGSGAASIAGDLVSGNTYQQIKLVDGTLGSSTPLVVLADNSIKASVYGSFSLSGGNASVSGTVGASIIGSVNVNPVSVSGTVGASVIGTVPVTQSGAWSASIVGTQTVQGLNAPTASVTGNPVYAGGIDVNGSIAGLQIRGGALLSIGSISGTAGASVIGTVPVTQSGTWSQSVVGATASVLQIGTWSQSVVGATASVLQLGVWNVNAASSVTGATVGGINAPSASITGSPVYVGGKDANGSIQGAQIIGGLLMTNGSVSGTVGASIIGTAPATQSGTWSVSVVGATASVLQIGTWSVSVVGATASVLQLGTWNVNAASSVIGATASISGISSVGGTISENPVNVGGKAVSAEQTKVATGNKAQFVSDLVGKQITLPYANPENFVSGVTSVVTGTTATSVLAAAGAGLRNYVTHIVVTNIVSSVVTVGNKVNITDDGTGNVLYSAYAAANGGGFSLTLPTPLRQPSSNFSISVTPATQGSIVAAMTGYIGA